MIPVTFDPPAWESEHLEIRKEEHAYSITWRETGITVWASKPKEPEHKNLLRHTPTLKFHGMFGYSIGTYHEFFIGAVDNYAEFGLGKADVSIGDVSPLAIFLFGAYYHRKAHGDEWNYLSTVRIQNAPVEFAEMYLLNALQLFGDGYFEQPVVLPFGPVEWWEPAEPKALPERVTSIPVDIEPLRFFYYGRRETEHESACLQFYRVLEFYAFFEVQADVAKLRGNTALSDREFLTRVANVIFRNERTPIVRLVTRLAGKRLLARAVKAGLITQEQPELLGEALYAFRNSFVHAKYDQRALILSPSLLEEDSKLYEWRHILGQLAQSAIAKLSKRRK